MSKDNAKVQQLKLIGLDQPTETLYNVLADTLVAVEPESSSSSEDAHSSSSSDEDTDSTR